MVFRVHADVDELWWLELVSASKITSAVQHFLWKLLTGRHLISRTIGCRKEQSFEEQDNVQENILKHNFKIRVLKHFSYCFRKYVHVCEIFPCVLLWQNNLTCVFQTKQNTSNKTFC